jgi:protein phosphatase
MLLRHAAATNVGRVRDHNEDSYAIKHGDGRAPSGALFVVCDGMGGYARGEVASDVAAKAIEAHYDAYPDADRGALLHDAFVAANTAVLGQGHGDMGTTAVAAIVRHNVATVANVGDCRAYLVRNGQPRQITHDHSFVAEQVAAGILTDEQAKASSYRHIVTRAIGQRDDLQVDVYHEPLQVNDVVVLCSDGLHGQVDADEIALAVSKVPLAKACEKLVALANTRGGPDNITLVAVQVAELDDPATIPPPPPADSAGPAKIATSALAAASMGTNGRSGSTGPVAQRAVVAPPLAPPKRSGRGDVRWLATLLMVAALSFGGYLLFRAQPPATTPASLAPPPLTPLGDVTVTPDEVFAPAAVAETAITIETGIISETAESDATAENATPPADN